MTDPTAHRVRVRILVRGAVQGVGFRPFIHRLATSLALGGWVRNDGEGVVIEVEGGPAPVQEFLQRLERDKPPLALIRGVERRFVDPEGGTGFTIVASSQQGSKAALILPDVATCPDCLRELFDPQDRRFRHPFINCTNCGPRFSIIEALPYDRPNTSMKKFRMCPDCEREYEDPSNRRFHAQPTACPSCGPALAVWDESGSPLEMGYSAVEFAANELKQGRVLALKGIGGFQLLVDARNEEAVRRLRLRKHREEKPFALMVPDLESARSCCEVAPLEQRALVSSQAPIVLLRRIGGWPPAREGIAPAVAPSNPYLGVMLPYSPLHHLLLQELGFPVVATSGNLTDEPICTDEGEAVNRLHGIADAFLVHDRPIVRYVDDSVVRVLLGREQVLRRARGYAPLPVHVNASLPTVLAVGGHLKNTVALSRGTEVFLSQHIGDLETEPANEAFRRIARDLPELYGAQPEVVACDLHPEYHSTAYANRLNTKVVAVQHHRAHVLACMAENELEPPALGVSWDGTGLGEDGTIWGGEFLLEQGTSFQRIAHLRSFRLPGGEAAIREPRRCALSVLVDTFGEAGFDLACELGLWQSSDPELKLLRQMLERGIQSPVTTSAGRLFDAVAALIGLRKRVSFEGQAAMELEFVAATGIAESYPHSLSESVPIAVDWRPTLRAILDDVRGGVNPGVMAAKFHRSLSTMVCSVARHAGQRNVVLTGGCFQNRLLTEQCVQALEAEGFRPVWHQRVPPNDGGISLGQVMAAVRAIPAAAVPEAGLATSI